ncbi:MAG: hypothetical protein ACJ71D_12700 [Nitrososphaera sp.]
MITAFNTLLATFHRYPPIDESGLPFGMTIDSYGMIDPRTGQGTEASIPISGSFVQWITSATRQGPGLLRNEGLPSAV